MKNKKKFFYIIALAMLIVALIFIVYALNHPEASFSWNNTITYTIYLIYLVVMIGAFIVAKYQK